MIVLIMEKNPRKRRRGPYVVWPNVVAALVMAFMAGRMAGDREWVWAGVYTAICLVNWWVARRSHQRNRAWLWSQERLAEILARETQKERAAQLWLNRRMPPRPARPRDN